MPVLFMNNRSSDLHDRRTRLTPAWRWSKGGCNFGPQCDSKTIWSWEEPSFF